MKYEEVTQDTVNSLLQTLKNNGTIPETGYKVRATLKKYNEIAGNESKRDLIKILTVEIEYSLKNKNEITEVSRLIIKEKV